MRSGSVTDEEAAESEAVRLALAVVERQEESGLLAMRRLVLWYRLRWLPTMVAYHLAMACPVRWLPGGEGAE